MDDRLTESELSLIHALQIRPRATWAELAPILHTGAATLARRWDSITAQGLAWVTAYPGSEVGGGTITAMIDMTCTPDRMAEIVDGLVQDPRVVSIEHSAPGRDLVLTVRAGSFDDLSRLVLEELRARPGVEASRTHTCTALHIEGSRWRLDALDAEQTAALARLEDPARRSGPKPEGLTDEVTRALIRELARDGRASATQIAQALGRPVSSVRRQLTALLRTKDVVLRCDVAQSATRWPITVTWWCRLPVAAHREVVELVMTRPEVRVCMSMTGPANFLVSMWVSSMPDLLRMQGWMESRAPRLEIVESSLTLRSRKRMGWELDDRGRTTGFVTSGA